MQLITNISKFIVLTVLVSCSIIILMDRRSSDIAVSIANVSTAIDANKSLTRVENSARAAQRESVWNSIRSEFRLDHNVQSKRVQAEIRKLLADRETLHHILNAAAPYIYYIHQQTRARGLPAEIALIPFIESEFNPNNKSDKGALGLWQLMSGTAHELGVKVRKGYDGRRNVIASTKAALAYFKDLGVYFKGNWYLAIAAYNAGQGRVDSAKRRADSNSYWNLPLPQETKLYVPKLLAVAAIIKNPEKYGVQLPPIENEPYFTELKIEKPANLTKISESTGVNIKILQRLNPDFKHDGVMAKKEGMYSLLVPVDAADKMDAMKS